MQQKQVAPIIYGFYLLLLMAQIRQSPPGMYEPNKIRDKLPTSTGKRRISGINSSSNHNVLPWRFALPRWHPPNFRPTMSSNARLVDQVL